MIVPEVGRRTSADTRLNSAAVVYSLAARSANPIMNMNQYAFLVSI